MQFLIYGVAALRLKVLLKPPILNVKINMSSIKDEEYKNLIKKDIENLGMKVVD